MASHESVRRPLPPLPLPGPSDGRPGIEAVLFRGGGISCPAGGGRPCMKGVAGAEPALGCCCCCGGASPVWG